MTRPVSLTGWLQAHRRIGLDTSPFIYQLEGHAKYGPAVAPLFAWLERHGAAFTSPVTMTELLVQPYRADDVDRVNLIYALTSTYPRLEWIPMSLAIADEAARLRARYRLRTPDAIQMATALSAGATGFVANDAAFRRVTEIDVLLIDDLGTEARASPDPAHES